MVSASKVKNCIIDNHLYEWLSYYNINNLTDVPKELKKQFNNFTNKQNNYSTRLTKQGIEYENKVINKIKNDIQNTNISFIEICESYQSREIKYFEKTKQAMKDGINIIYQGVLHDYENNIYGCPDLLIRSDKFNRIFNNDYLNSFDSNESYFGNYYYIVVDIKNNKLDYRKDSRLLKSHLNVNMNKGQLYVYTKALKNIQGYEPSISFIYGKNNKLGEIDYNDNDKDYKKKVNDAIKWVLDMRENGHNWKIYPEPSNRYLYPNMNVTSIDYNKKNKRIKKELAEAIGEITLLYQCGIMNREIGFNNGIRSLNDKRCSSESLGFVKGAHKRRIDRILETNHSECMVLPLLIRNDKFNWHHINDSSMEFYCDFETINLEFIGGNNTQYVFMIGIGYIENDNFNFKCFVAENTSEREERRIFMDCINFMKIKSKELNFNNYHMIHWNNTERTITKKVLDRYGLKDKLNFIDLLDLFMNIEEPIGVKGAYNYKLKTIGTSLNKLGLIDIKWNEDECDNGLDAMYRALDLYERDNVNGREMKQIIDYNEIDCRVLYDIISYLRLNH